MFVSACGMILRDVRKVFVSYSHDSPEHSARVRGLAAQLRDDLKFEKCEIILDQFAGDPDEGWPAWCETQVCEADKILVTITATYRRRYDGKEKPGVGCGATFEAAIVRQELYDAGLKNPKYRAILFENGDQRFIPKRLKGNNVYCVTDPLGYQGLVGWLSGVARGPAIKDERPRIAWAQPREDFLPQLANRKPEFCHFKRVLAGEVPERILLLRGPSNSGKTALVGAMYGYSRHVDVAVSRVELKGCPSIEDVLDVIAFQLKGEAAPHFCVTQKSERSIVKLLEDLQHLNKPVVLAFDTYQESSDLVRKSLEGVLLPLVDQTSGVVVVLCGQQVPEAGKQSWEKTARVVDLPAITEVDDWLDYIRRTLHDAHFKREWLEAFTTLYNGNPGDVSAAIRTVAQKTI